MSRTAAPLPARADSFRIPTAPPPTTTTRRLVRSSRIGNTASPRGGRGRLALRLVRGRFARRRAGVGLAVRLPLLVQRVAVDPESRRGLHLIVSRFLQHGLDQFALDAVNEEL